MEQGLDAAMKRAPSDLPALLWFLPGFVKRRIVDRPNLIKILDNIGWLFFDKILRMGVGLIVGVWVARYLGPEQYGYLSYALAFVGLFSSIASVGLNGIVVRNIIQKPKDTGVILGTALSMQLSGSIISIVAINVLIPIIEPQNILIQSIVTIVGASLFFKFSDVVKYLFESKTQSKIIIITENIIFIMFSVVKIVLIFSSESVIKFAFVNFAESFFLSVCLFAIFYSQSKSIRQIKFDFNVFKSLFNDSWPLIISGISILIYMKIDQIMIGNMIGIEAVGIYSVATKLSEIFYFIPMVVCASFFPDIISAKKTSTDLYYEKICKLCSVLTLIGITLLVPVFLFSEKVIIEIFGGDYADATNIFLIQFLSYFPFSFGIILGKFYIIENFKYENLRRNIIGSALNIILNFFWIEKYGVEGAAFASFLSYTYISIGYAAFNKKSRRIFTCMTNIFFILKTK